MKQYKTTSFRRDNGTIGHGYDGVVGSIELTPYFAATIKLHEKKMRDDQKISKLVTVIETE